MNIKAGLGLGVGTALLAASAGLTATPVTAAPLPPQATSASSTAASAGPALHFMAPIRPASSRPRGGGGPSNLTYHGGSVMTSPTVVLVFWGQQWDTDHSAYSSYLQDFLGGLGTNNETWSASTTQYCSQIGVGSLASACPSTSTNFVGHLRGNQLVKTIVDDTRGLAPRTPTQSQLAQEAVWAATSAGTGASAQVVVATSSGNNSSGFGSQYCAWHSSTSFTAGTLSYTNLPYITDAGAGCGQNFVNKSSGVFDGLSIVEGHELAETLTDPAPNSGWLDGSGSENGDKCAWISPGLAGGATDISLTTTTGLKPFAVQGLWSDKSGSCVTSYP